MRLSDFLSVDRVSVDFSAENKALALQKLAELFGADDRGDAPIHQIVTLLSEREALATTGVGSGVAIPHGRVPQLPRTVGAVAVSSTGVDFEAIDGEPVFVFVCLLAPRETGSAVSRHLQALARISRVLRQSQVRDAVRRATSPEGVLATLYDAEARAPSTE